MIPELRQDEFGDLCSGLFYDLLIMPGSDQELYPRFAQSGAISSPSLTDDTRVRAEVVNEVTQAVHDCPIDARHCSGYRVLSWHVDLFAGDHTGPFVCDCAGNRCLVSPAFAELLMNQGFSGLEVEKTPVGVNQSSLQSPDIRALRFLGRMHRREPRIYPAESNHCGTCRFSPVLCNVCGHRWWKCPQCGADVFATEKQHLGKDDRRIIIRRAPRKAILECGDWAGEDFIRDVTVSKRVVDYLVAVNASPFMAIPVYIDISTANAHQRQLLGIN